MIFQFLSDIILIQLIKNLFRTLQFRLIGLSSAHAGIIPPYAMVMEGVHSKGLYELGGINSKWRVPAQGCVLRDTRDTSRQENSFEIIKN